MKVGEPRAKRARSREFNKVLVSWRGSVPPVGSSSRSVTPVETPPSLTPQQESLTVSVGEQLDTNYTVHELPGASSSECNVPSSSTVATNDQEDSVDCVVNAGLLSKIELLEAENHRLKTAKVCQHFRIDQLQSNDRLFRFYTGFISYAVFLAFFKFLGPVVNELNYWGCKEKEKSQRRRSCKLDPINQLFLTLVKLRLNLKVQDLAYRFGISTGSVSNYLTTWISFLYHHLKELNWSPCVEQVMGTLPHAFRQKFPSTYAIIDGSELFIQTPSDLYMQSSTWSQYKHQNTFKFLVSCTPNGAISYISDVFVGSISDVELMKMSGFLKVLEDMPGVSIMADRGFTIKDVLKELNVELNMPPFLEGQKQLPAEKVQEGRTISSLRIHVERAIGKIKNYSILKETIPINLARLTNQIVHVCAFLSNFQPALVPPPELTSEADVDEYFASQQLSLSDSETSAGSEEEY